MHTSNRMAGYLDTAQLDGFNPLKAIGRALGSTGRALVSAIPVIGQGASAVLDTAARQPAKGGGDTPAALPATPGVPVATTQSTTDLINTLIAASLTKNNAPAAPLYAPQQAPIYAPSQYAPPSTEMPPWLIPAMIGGLGLILVLGKK